MLCAELAGAAPIEPAAGAAGAGVGAGVGEGVGEDEGAGVGEGAGTGVATGGTGRGMAGEVDACVPGAAAAGPPPAESPGAPAGRDGAVCPGLADGLADVRPASALRDSSIPPDVRNSR